MDCVSNLYNVHLKLGVSGGNLYTYWIDCIGLADIFHNNCVLEFVHEVFIMMMLIM